MTITTEIQQNRTDWLAMLRDPRNQHRQCSGLLGSNDRCCALGLWVRERYPELAELALFGPEDEDDDTDYLENAYQQLYDDLDLRGCAELIWDWNDTQELPFRGIADRIEQEIFAR